jgi:WD40 repeat protein
MVRVWDVETGALLAVLPAHIPWVSALVFSADGSVLVSAGVDGVLRVWGVGVENVP